MLACWKENKLAEVYSQILKSEEENVKENFVEEVENEGQIKANEDQQVEQMKNSEVQILDENHLKKETLRISEEFYHQIPVQAIVELKETDDKFEMTPHPNTYQNNCCSVS